MKKFMVLLYDKDGANSSFDRKESTNAFAEWMDGITSVVDRGAPFTENVRSISKTESTTPDLPLSNHSPNGYFIIEGSSIDEVVSSLSECPIFSEGGSLEVREILSV